MHLVTAFHVYIKAKQKALFVDYAPKSLLRIRSNSGYSGQVTAADVRSGRNKCLAVLGNRCS